VDIDPKTMNIDANLIEDAITEKTKAIVPVHYAGVSCDMDKIMEIAKRHNLIVIEDAAQGIMSTYHGKALGTIGDYGCYSFHETKNYSMGEGGAILIKDKDKAEEAEIIREKGTNRSKFFRGQIDKYTSPSLISHKRAAISVACVHDVVRSALAVFVFSSSHALHFLVNSPSPQIFLFSTAFLI